MLPLKTIMTKDVISVKEDTPIFEAMQMLKNYKISGLPVVDNEMMLKGILTEKDVLVILNAEKIEYSETVSDYMTQDVVSFSENDSAMKACQFFIDNAIRRVPVTENGKLIGIVSRRDIISLILDARSKMSDARFS